MKTRRYLSSHKTHHKGVSLSGENLDRVDSERLAVNAINFDDSHIVVVNREDEVRTTRDSHQAETVAKWIVFEQEP